MAIMKAICKNKTRDHSYFQEPPPPHFTAPPAGTHGDTATPANAARDTRKRRTHEPSHSHSGTDARRGPARATQRARARVRKRRKTQGSRPGQKQKHQRGQTALAPGPSPLDDVGSDSRIINVAAANSHGR
jgi:hypothetical protein